MFEKTLSEIFRDKNINLAKNSLKNSVLGIDLLDLDAVLTPKFIQNLIGECLNLSYAPKQVLQKFIPKDSENF